MNSCPAAPTTVPCWRWCASPCATRWITTSAWSWRPTIARNWAWGSATPAASAGPPRPATPVPPPWSPWPARPPRTTLLKDREMMTVDLQHLLRALDADSRRDLERAAERCVARAGGQVLVEDLLLTLLERDDSLLLRALRDAEVEPDALADALRPGDARQETRNPVFCPGLVQWLQDALMLATLELGQRHIDQAALL